MKKKDELTLAEEQLPQLLTKEQLVFLTQKTPKEMVKQRPGRGGKSFDYVEVGYVTNILNKVFGYNWDFVITGKEIVDTQVVVEGMLRVRMEVKGVYQEIIRSNFGGSDIKKDTSNGRIVDLADDLKSAASDCLKKCASSLGVAGDIYWRDLEKWDNIGDEVHTEDARPATATPAPIVEQAGTMGGPVKTQTSEPCPSCGELLIKISGISKKTGKPYGFKTCDVCHWKSF